MTIDCERAATMMSAVDEGTTTNNPASDEEIAAWRRDPAESFSDWTIYVVPTTKRSSTAVVATDNETEPGKGKNTAVATVNPDSNETLEKIYHVHRVYLASGPRCSEYFKTLFSTHMSTEEGASQTTRLELQESACRAFPALLDYIYTGHIHVGGSTSSSCGGGRNDAAAADDDEDNDAAADGDDDDNDDDDDGANDESGQVSGQGGEEDEQQCKSMSEEEIVALLYLADYLQVGNLIPATSEYIQEELQPNNIHLFCQEALLYGIDWIVQACIPIAAASPKHLLVTHDSSSRGTIDDPTTLDAAPAPSSTGRPSVPAAQQVLAMLPQEGQIQLLQMSLERSVNELNRFKRLPSRWKENIDETAIASHMPVMATGNSDSEHFHQPYAVSLAGCGLPFPNKVCPVFYFDQDNSDLVDNGAGTASAAMVDVEDATAAGRHVDGDRIRNRGSAAAAAAARNPWMAQQMPGDFNPRRARQLHHATVRRQNNNAGTRRYTSRILLRGQNAMHRD